ncbi:hypothetical protein AAG570_005014 [Ranatra chinensis]|uniref:CRAL-TRIO domain-containing protein n=1 Tax=Ranatra chinensis TaxID=642074 RepID=A0ABD0XZ89_9HEMI
MTVTPVPTLQRGEKGAMVSSTNEEAADEVEKPFPGGEEDLNQKMAEIRSWLSEQPHLPHNLGDNLLTAFVVGCKWNMDRAKKRLDFYFTARSHFRELFEDRDPCGKAIAATNKFWRVLFYRLRFFDIEDCTPEGYSGMFVSLWKLSAEDDDPDSEGIGKGRQKRTISYTNHYLDFYRRMLMLFDLRLIHWPKKPGDVYVVDMACVPLSGILAISHVQIRHVIKTVVDSSDVYYDQDSSAEDSNQLKPVQTNQLKARDDRPCKLYQRGCVTSLLFQECNPIRLKAIILFNMPYILTVALNNIIRPLLSKKIASRFFFYSCGAECLVNHCKVDKLPAEYGGSNKTIVELHDACYNELVQNREWFLTVGSLTSDESKRPEELKKRKSFFR